MNTYRCKACGYIYSNKEIIPFEKLNEKWKCPLCKRKKSQFEICDEFSKKEVYEVINSDITPYNAVIIDEENPSIERTDGCINCGICTRTCLQRENMNDKKCLMCVGCGQCIMTCPKKVLQPKSELYKFFDAKNEGKICIAYVAPGARVSIGDEFGHDAGSLLGTKLVGLLKKLGFKYVFDVTLGADITIMEEVTELLKRIENNDNLPMITSCCPSWVRYAEIFYPDLLKHLSTSKSPISMMGAIVKNYFASINQINPNDIFTVAITPCTSKKWEITKPELKDTDLVITINELTEYLNNTKIDFKKIRRCKFDSDIGFGSSAGLIFGSSGGVMEAALRTAYYFETGKPLKHCEFTKLRGYNGIRSMEVKLGKKVLKVAVVDEMSNAKELLDQIRNKTSEYDFIEIMNCRGGCIGGGGQPYHKPFEEQLIKEKRMVSLYKKDHNEKYRNAYSNPSVKRIYKKFLNYPLSPEALKYLHTTYYDRSNEIKK